MGTYSELDEGSFFCEIKYDCELGMKSNWNGSSGVKYHCH